MIAYIIKFILCSGFLYSFYKVFLERESMYKINRFYLLFSIGFSLIAPLYKMELPMTMEETNISPELLAYLLANPQLLMQDEGLNYGEALNYFYGIIGFGLLLRFVFHIAIIIFKIKRDEKFLDNDVTYVLDRDYPQPFSFLNFIFLPKENYTEIHPNLIQHEKAHCIQKHSLDILIIEIFQVIFWFNPFIYLYKKSIKLNHEFLADEYVLQNDVDVKTYQHQILDCIASQSPSTFASNFNFILTKKRLLMMTKNTSKRKIKILSFASFPFILSAFILFSQKSFAQEVENNAKKVEEVLEQKIENSIKEVLTFKINENDSIRQIGSFKIDSKTGVTEISSSENISNNNKDQKLQFRISQDSINLKLSPKDIKNINVDKFSDIVTIVTKNKDTVKYKVQSTYIPNTDGIIKIDQLKTNELFTEKVKNKLKDIYPSGIKTFEIYKKDDKNYIRTEGKEYVLTDDLNVLKELSKSELEKLNKAKDLLNNKKFSIENIKVKIDTLKQPSPWKITVEPHSAFNLSSASVSKPTNKIEMVDGQSIYYDKNGVKHNILNSEVKIDKTPLTSHSQLKITTPKDSKSLKVSSLYLPETK